MREKLPRTRGDVTYETDDYGNGYPPAICILMPVNKWGVCGRSVEN